MASRLIEIVPEDSQRQLGPLTRRPPNPQPSVFREIDIVSNKLVFPAPKQSDSRTASAISLTKQAEEFEKETDRETKEKTNHCVLWGCLGGTMALFSIAYSAFPLFAAGLSVVVACGLAAEYFSFRGKQKKIKKRAELDEQLRQLGGRQP